MRKEERKRGYGTKLIHFIEEYAKDADIKELYLITTTASDYFSKVDYRIINRAEVPVGIKESTEFSATCPASAIVMKKSIQKEVKS